jgi:hypothetical protein
MEDEIRYIFHGGNEDRGCINCSVLNMEPIIGPYGTLDLEEISESVPILPYCRELNRFVSLFGYCENDKGETFFRKLF